MLDSELQRLVLRKCWLQEFRILLVLPDQFLGVLNVRLLHSCGSVVEHQKDATSALDELEDVGVVVEFDTVEGHAFLLVLLELLLEDELIEVLLELFVGKVDEELLELVYLEYLKSCYVKHTEEGLREHILAAEGQAEGNVASADQPFEQTSVDHSGERVACLACLLRAERALDELDTGLDQLLAQNLAQALLADPENSRSHGEFRLVLDC
mmetsp:Transcript_33267/g.91710  ORF Transcript_33267/g.91710 Transcript_33267/m.91710 type:complete len:211 (-) Transcript_33267:1070-1702(-)